MPPLDGATGRLLLKLGGPEGGSVSLTNFIKALSKTMVTTGSKASSIVRAFTLPGRDDCDRLADPN